MHIAWGALPVVLFAAAITVGQTLVTRYEMKTGNGLLFFVPYEPWSRGRNPMLFKIRQVFNWFCVAFFAAGTLGFCLLMFGIGRA